MDFGGVYYPWLHLWMLSAVPLITFCLGAFSWKILRKWTLLLIVMGIIIVVTVKIAGG